MRDNDRSQLLFLVELTEQCKHLFACLLIKIPGRLVRQEQSWSRNQGACQRDALSLTAREFAGTMRQAGLQPNPL